MKKYLLFGVIVIIFVALAWSYVAHAITGGPSFPSNSVNGLAPAGQTGNVNVWGTPSNMNAEDGVFATTTNTPLGSAGHPTNYASTTAYGFSIPTSATIVGIQVDVKRKASQNDPSSNGYVIDQSVKLMNAGFVVGTDRALISSPTNDWPTTLTYVTYGGPTDLWTSNWTPTDINNSLFGVAFSAHPVAVDVGAPQGSVDDIRITIYYVGAHGVATQVTHMAGTIIQTNGTVLQP